MVNLNLPLKTPQKAIHITYCFFGGVFNGKLKFTIKDPPKKVIRVTYCNSSAILLIKCLKKIRKYIVDTCLEFKYSLANNEYTINQEKIVSQEKVSAYKYNHSEKISTHCVELSSTMMRRALFNLVPCWRKNHVQRESQFAHKYLPN